jgi:hypothetical protein
VTDSRDDRSPLEPFDIEGAFADQEEELAATLARGRRITRQPGIVGDATEGGWKHMLCAFLPGRYGVVSGKVVDSQGHQSQQIDVIVHDTYYSPLMFTIGTDRFVPVESVYAVFEIKQTLNRAHLDAAAEKAESVRRLHRTSAEIPNHFGIGTSKDLSRFPILAGLLTSQSEWAVPFDDILRGHLEGQTPEQAVDFGCALGAGAFDAEREPLVSGRSLIDLSTSVPGRALSFFAMRLLHRLQQLGTVGAIDYEAYAAPIVSD